MTASDLRDRLRPRGLLEMVEDAAREHHVTLYELASRVRTAHVSRARHEAWRRLRAAGLSYSVIGALFDRDHTTVLRALEGAA